MRWPFPVPPAAALALAFALAFVGCATAPSGVERYQLEARGIRPPSGSVKVADAHDDANAWVTFRYANDTSVPTLTQTWARVVREVSWAESTPTLEGNVGVVRATKSGLALKVWVGHSNATTCCVESADRDAPVMSIVVVSGK